MLFCVYVYVVVITVFAFVAYSKHSHGEVCAARPIHQYLFTAGLHASANGLIYTPHHNTPTQT